MGEVREALENAAGADDEAIVGGMIGAPTLPSKRRIGGAREVIKRFLQDLPGDMTVSEIIGEIDE